MTGRLFLDTNILVYLFDADAPTKQSHVRQLLSNQTLHARLILSTQVLQEFYVTVTRNLATPLEPVAAAQAVRDLATWAVVPIDPSLILSAVARSQVSCISFWDALIVEAALSGGATDLYSEDLQDGLIVEGMRISNPFRSGFQTPQNL